MTRLIHNQLWSAICSSRDIKFCFIFPQEAKVSSPSPRTWLRWRAAAPTWPVVWITMITLPSSGQTLHNRLYSLGTRKVSALLQGGGCGPRGDRLWNNPKNKKENKQIWPFLIRSEHQSLADWRIISPLAERPNRMGTVWKMNFAVGHAVVRGRLMLVGCEMMKPN